MTLPPGRFRLATRPSLTGSPPIEKTIGIVAVAALAAIAAYGPGRSDHGDLATHQIDRQLWQSIVLTLRPVVYDRDIPAFDITSFVQALPEGAQTNNVRSPVTRC